MHEHCNPLLQYRSITLELFEGRSIVLDDVLESSSDFNGAAALRIDCIRGSIVAIDADLEIGATTGDFRILKEAQVPRSGAYSGSSPLCRRSQWTWRSR